MLSEGMDLIPGKWLIPAGEVLLASLGSRTRAQSSRINIYLVNFAFLCVQALCTGARLFNFYLFAFQNLVLSQNPSLSQDIGGGCNDSTQQIAAKRAGVTGRRGIFVASVKLQVLPAYKTESSSWCQGEGAGDFSFAALWIFKA